MICQRKLLSQWVTREVINGRLRLEVTQRSPLPDPNPDSIEELGQADQQQGN